MKTTKEWLDIIMRFEKEKAHEHYVMWNALYAMDEIFFRTDELTEEQYDELEVFFKSEGLRW